MENLVWFKKTLSNVLQDRPSPYFSSSKEILLIFKRGDGFELRHQRTADVLIDFERPTEQWIHEGKTREAVWVWFNAHFKNLTQPTPILFQNILNRSLLAYTT